MKIIGLYWSFFIGTLITFKKSFSKLPGTTNVFTRNNCKSLSHAKYTIGGI